MAAGTKLSERDICTKFITPALIAAGWDVQTQIREEVSFTKGRIIVRGRLVTRGKAKRADYVLYYKHLPLALIEAKDHVHAVGDGMQQALGYAETLDIPYVFSSNGKGFVFHDRSGLSAQPEQSLALSDFPSPTELWNRYRTWKGLTALLDRLTHRCHILETGNDSYRFRNHGADIKKEAKTPTSTPI